MVDVLLIYPPHHSGFKNPPLGLLYVAAVLRESGYTTEIIDFNMVSDMERFFKKLPARIEKASPKWVGISTMTRQFTGAVRIAQLVKIADPSLPVVVGGVHVSELPREVLSQQPIDFVVFGEGEMTMLDLVQGKPLDSIDGLGYKEDGKLFINANRPLIADLDSIPLPAWDLLPYKKDHGGQVSGSMGLSGDEITGVILSSRGCPNNCIFCDSSSVFGRKFRCRSASNVVSEIEILYWEHGIKQFDFVDDTMTVDRRRVFELCDIIIEKGLNIKWACNARVNTISKEMLLKLKAAGCVRVDFGVESGDPVVLKNIGKKINLEQVKTAFKLCKEVGIKTMAFFMVGNLGEDFDSIKKSAALAREIDSDYYAYSIATPYPGTELYRIGTENNWIKIRDWDKYVTGPGYYENYLPVMDTDKMNQREILEGFHLFDSKLKLMRYKKRYGRWYFLNPAFYIDNISDVRSIKDLRRKTAKGSRFLVKSLSSLASN